MEPHLGRERVAVGDRVHAMARVRGIEIGVEVAYGAAEPPVEDLLDPARGVLLAQVAPARVALHLLDREGRGVLWLLERAEVAVLGARRANRELDASAADGQRDRLRRGPGPRPVRRGDPHAQAVPGRE